MESSCLKCRNYTKNINSQVWSTSNGKKNDIIKM